MARPNPIRSFKGIVRGANPYAAPPGACEVADNVVIRSQDAILPRPGFSSLGLASSANALAFKQGALIALSLSATGSEPLKDDGQGFFPAAVNQSTPGYQASPSSFAPTEAKQGYGYNFPDNMTPGGVVGARTKCFQYNKALYWMGRFGLLKVEDLTAASPADFPCINNPPSTRQVTAATGTLTISGGSGTVGGTIGGTAVTVAWATSDTATAAALATAINANVTVKAKVYATSLLGVVTICALQSNATYVGVGGNAVTLVASGTGVTASAATLTGGAGAGTSEAGSTVLPFVATVDPTYGASAGNGWLVGGYQVAYRATVCRYGENNELIESAPSERILVTNQFDVATNVSGAGAYQGALAAVRLSNTPPPNTVPPGAWVRWYRSASVLASLGFPPSDECFLVAETASGTAVFDQTPDSALYLPLYTNPVTGNGIVDAHTNAPIGFDVATFRNRAYAFNIVDVHRLAIRVIGTGTGGLTDGDTLAVNGTTYRFKSTPAQANDVTLYTAGTVAQNIENTARALCAAVNQVWLNGALATQPWASICVATYTASTNADIGAVTLARSVPGAAAFTATASATRGWDKDYTAGKSSAATTEPNRLCWSDYDQPECWPLNNFARIGGMFAAGLALVPLRNSMMVFKADGLWIAADDGSTLGPVVLPGDPSMTLAAPQTAVALDNLAFALCSGGVFAVSESGSKTNISHDRIESDLRRLMAYVGATTLSAQAFAVANEAKHEYMLFLPESPTATSATLCYVYNTVTDTWVRWPCPFGVTAAAVSPDTQQVVLAVPGPGFNTLWLERQAGDASDAQDPWWTPFGTLSPTSPFALPLTGGLIASLTFPGDVTGFMAPGDYLQQPQAVYFVRQRVTAVAYSHASGLTTVTLDAAPTHPWANPDALNAATFIQVVRAVQSSLKFLPFTAGDPSAEKTWGRVYLAFRRLTLDFFTAAWSTERYPVQDSAQERISALAGAVEPLPPVLLDGWGSRPWDSWPWERQAVDVLLLTTLPQTVGRSAQLTLQLTLANALASWELAAIDPHMDAASAEGVR